MKKTSMVYSVCILIQLCCSPQNHWRLWDASNTPLTSNRIRQIIVENNELSWVGTYGGGLYKITQGTFQKVNSSFSACHILCLRQDNRGGLWIGTAKHGGYYYAGETWTRYTRSSGLCDDNVWDILIDNSDTVWLCSRYRGVCRKSADSLRCFTIEHGLPDNQITAAAQDNRGWRWFGTARGGMAGYSNGHFTCINTRNGLSGNYIRAILCDSVPRWVGTWDGGLDYYTGETWENVGAVKKPVVFLGLDAKGALWAGTWGQGVYTNRSGAWKNLTVKNSGLPDNYVIDIDFAEDGTVYFATSGGVAACSP